MDSTLLCNQKVASVASRAEGICTSSGSSTLPGACKDGKMEDCNNKSAMSSLAAQFTAESLLSSKSCGGATLKQRVRDKVGETLLKNNIGSRLAALSSASSVTAAAAALKAGSGRSVASDPEIRPKPLVRSRSEQQDRPSQPSSQEFTKALPKRYASARTSSAPDPDGRVVRDDVFYADDTISGRIRPRDMNRLTSLSEHAVPSSQSPLRKSPVQSSATLPSRSAHARIPTIECEVASPVRDVTSFRRKEPPGTSPYKNHLLPSPPKNGYGLQSNTDGYDGKKSASPTVMPILSPTKMSSASGGSSGCRTNQLHTGATAVASTESTASPSRTSKLKEEISASNASKAKSESPRLIANRSAMTLLAAHLEKTGSPTANSRSAQSMAGDRPGRSRSRSRCRGDGMSVASSCTHGSQSRRRVQRSVSRGRTGIPSHLAEAGASSAMPRPGAQGRRRPGAASPPTSTQEKEQAVAQDISSSSDGNNAIEYDFDDGADDVLLGRKPSSKHDRIDDEDSVSGASTASGSISWTPPPRRSNRRSHSVGRVCTKRFDEHGVSWGELPPSSSGTPTGPTQIRGRSGCSSKSRSRVSCQESESPEPRRPERRRSLTLSDAKAIRDEVSTLGIATVSSTKKRESKIDPTLLIKGIVEASTRTKEEEEEEEEEPCPADTDKQPSRGIKKSLSGMLRRRPSFSSTSVSSAASLSSKSRSSVPSMFAQLLQPGKGSRGEPLLSPASSASGSTLQGSKETSLSSSSSPSVQQALYQSSVTTHASSDESSSSIGE